MLPAGRSEGSGVKRYDVRRRIEELDPARDFREIYRLTSTYEFPWDINQALNFALFRTYAVPGIGGLTARTGELVHRAQKRYDDTVLILDAMMMHGPTVGDGRTALRRMNRMHGSYDIDNDQLRYVLCTFVVTPIRWMDEYGWRRMCETERIASANYYRDLGRHMGIRDIPQTWQGFARHMDDYERACFGFDAGARSVADATLDLLATFPPNDKLPARFVRHMSFALMDDPLLDAFGLPHPNPLFRAVVRGGLKVRGRVVRWMPPRTEPFSVRELKSVRSYPDGYDLAELGTFPPHHARRHEGPAAADPSAEAAPPSPAGPPRGGGVPSPPHPARRHEGPAAADPSAEAAPA